MYKPLGNVGAAPQVPGWVYIGQDASNFYYQQAGVAGLWGAIKSVAKKVVSPVVKVAASFVPGGSVIREGIASLVNVVRGGTERQVAEAMATNMTASQRAELERAYMERRAAELAGAARSYALPLAAAALALYLMRRRRR